MKKIIGIVIASLMFANIGFAEIRLIEKKLIKGEIKEDVIMFSTVCVDGYKFVTANTSSQYGEGLSMVQAISYAQGSYPQRC
ncbi:MAG: hypothetical protein QF864_17355 [SAR202 cluster bacterium]|jgi:hypothetical protein|nr:hypothetical protein [SAR202 cluster bacterium]